MRLQPIKGTLKHDIDSIKAYNKYHAVYNKYDAEGVKINKEGVKIN